MKLLQEMANKIADKFLDNLEAKAGAIYDGYEDDALRAKWAGLSALAGEDIRYIVRSSFTHGYMHGYVDALREKESCE